MIRDWDYLAPTAGPADEVLNILRAWLRSQTTESATLFTRMRFPLSELQPAVQAAVYEIRDNLDLQIGRLVQEALVYNIEIMEADYYITRDVDWNGMPEEEIEGMNEEVCISTLWRAKDEIAWLVNEISRLQAYVSIEKQARSSGWGKRNTVLWPLNRNT